MAASLELLGGDRGEHRLARDSHHNDDEPAPCVYQVVACLVVNNVAARFPERLTWADHPLGLTLEFEYHLSLEHVAEDGPRMAMRQRTGIAGW